MGKNKTSISNVINDSISASKVLGYESKSSLGENCVGFKNIVTHDIYPARENKWKDTHFYALVCEKFV